MIEMKKTVMAETKSKLAVRFFVSLLTLLFAVGGIFASGKAETEDSTGGQIYLYGETHAVEQILEEELRLWQEYYANGMRHLFVELPYYTAQYLNQWMLADDDEILMQVYADWNGTASHSANVSRFYRQIKETCPETVFHGTDVGHQYQSTGRRYLNDLTRQDLADSEEAQLARQNIEQGQRYYRTKDDVYRENTMVENFLREYALLNGESVMGIYGAAHTGLDAMDWSGQVPCMANQLRQTYGERLHSTDLSTQGLTGEPIRAALFTIGGKEYQAGYFGEQDLSGVLEGKYLSRQFYRLEEAYDDFKTAKLTGDILPANNYPMPIDEGQVFAICYTLADGTSRWQYYRCDGSEWNGQLTTLEFRIP